jgi:hypothetical protein
MSIGAGVIATHNLTSNPGFVDAEKADFRLLATSTQAIDKGMTLPEVLTDFSGTLRKAGAYDIGAFEYVPVGMKPSAPTAFLAE